MNHRSDSFMIRTAQTEMVDTGSLQITALSEQNLPIENATVDISYTGDPDSILEEVRTGSTGKTEILELNAPPIEYSLAPSETMPYAEYTIRITAPGYEPVVVSGIEVLSTQLALQNVKMRPLEAGELPDTITIPDHTQYRP